MGPAVCGLDIGSNTFSCAVVGRDAAGGPAVLRDTSVAVRLSEGLVPGGALRPAAVERGLGVLERLARDFDLRRMRRRVVATAVLRMAADPGSFADPASRLLGAPVEIIDEATEALLTTRGALLGLPGEGPRIVIDIGGQSTELCWTGQDGLWTPLSLPVGVVGLTARFLAADPPRPDEIRALGEAVTAELTARVPQDLAGEPVAVAGTATALARLELGGGSFDRAQVHGLGMDRTRLRSWLERMLEQDAAARTARYGIRAGRADVFPAGLVVLDRVLGHLGREDFVVSANGLRVGAALSILPEANDETGSRE